MYIRQTDWLREQFEVIEHFTANSVCANEQTSHFVVIHWRNSGHRLEIFAFNFFPIFFVAYKNTMLITILRIDSVEVVNPKPKQLVYGRPEKTKMFTWELYPEVFTDNIDSYSLSHEGLTFCSVKFLLRFGIAHWSNEKSNESTYPYVVDFLNNFFVISGSCSIPEFVLRTETKLIENHSRTKYLDDHLTTAHCQIFHRISVFI